MSSYAVEVVQLGELSPHPNAQRLAVVSVFGYTVVVAKADWRSGDLAAYIPPDSIVPNTQEFAFLDGHLRIRAKKLRGVISYGMLVPAPPGAKVGDDVAEQLGVTHYEPYLPASTSGNNVAAPPGFVGSKYDIENLRRYPGVIADGTLVMVTEKIHGACARYTFRQGVFYAGSRNGWKAESEACVWWRAARACPGIEAFCRQHQGYTLYGEVFGQVQKLRYGSPNGVRFAAFDVAIPSGEFMLPMPARCLMDEFSVPQVPLIYSMLPYSFNICAVAAEGDSLVPGADHVREGIVVKPMMEMFSPEIGRVILKCIGGGYLLL